MVDTYRVIDLPNFHSIQQIMRVVISTMDIPLEDGVYPFVGEVDIDQLSRSILPLVDSMKQARLYDYWVATSLVLTYKEIPIHKDNAVEFDYSLNLPILNTEDTYTTFYRAIDPPITRYLPNGLPYDAYDVACCEVIDSVEILNPTLLNVKTPHGVTLSSNKVPRITLAIRLNNYQ